MRIYSLIQLGVGLVLVLFIFYLYKSRETTFVDSIEEEPSQVKENELPLEQIILQKNDVVVAVVACGNRVQETLIMLKSALMFTKVKLNFIIFTEDDLVENFREKLSEWKSFTNNAFSYHILPLTFPPNDAEEWKRLFKPCAAQRLFLPNILKDVDSLLYMDTDTLFLTPVESIWEHFHKMNSSQMAALAPEHEDPNVAWYNRFAKHPYYGKLGVNSGVMLMNLTRMRAFKWSEYVVPIYKKYKLKITWGDQDIINIIFHYHPDKLYLYSCRYNYRPDHCMYMSVCKEADKKGVAVLHGSRGFFHSEKQPMFKVIYNAFETFPVGGDVYREFYQVLETNFELDEVQNSNCGHVKESFLKNLKHFMDFEHT